MGDDAILTARCDRPVTYGLISVRLDLAHYRMWPWGDRLSGPWHCRCTMDRGVPRCNPRCPKDGHAHAPPCDSLDSVDRCCLEFTSDDCNEAHYQGLL